MNVKRTLQEFTDQQDQNFANEVHEDCRKYSLSESDKFISKFPKLSRYQNIYAKIVFSSSIVHLLKLKFNQINAINTSTRPRQTIHRYKSILINVRNLFYLLYEWINLLILKTLTSFPEKSISKIGIELSEGLRPHNFRSDVNFEIESLGYDRVVFFDFQNVINRYSHAELEILKKCLLNGSLLVTNHDVPLKENTLKVSYPVIRKFYFGIPKNNQILFWEHYPFLKLSEQFWEFIFKKLSITGWFSTTEAPLDNLIQLNVMKNIGGIVFSRQRSEQSIAKALFAHPADVFFNWSASSNHHFKKFNLNEVIKPVGHNYLNINRWNEYEKSSIKIKNSFPENTFIIALFDNVVGDIYEMSSEYFHSLITYLISVLKSDPSIRVIFKLKKKSFIKQYPERAIIEQLIQENRIVLLDGYILPVIIGMAADISIGIGGSSSVSEVNIAGKRGIHFWPAPSHDHPLTNKTLAPLIVTNIEQLKKSIESVLSNPKCNTGILDNSSALLDEYGDYKGPERVLFCLKKLLQNDMNRDQYLEWIANVDLENIETL